MSDADHDLPHEGPIKTPKQLMAAVGFAFVVPVIAIILLVKLVSSDKTPAAGSDAMSAESTERRIQPVGHVEIKDMNDLSTLKSGEQVYAAQCVACHGAGLVGAPKLGDAAAWAPRVKSGYDALLAAALKGKGNMGAQGGGDFGDIEIGRAVVYMANQGGAQFAEPATAAVTAAAPAAEVQAVAAASVVATMPAVVAPAVTQAAAPVLAKTAPPALYTQACAVCHDSGLANAPKLGDKAGWAARLASGVDGLSASAIKGKGMMPPRGGAAASDADIKAAVAYMVSRVQ